MLPEETMPIAAEATIWPPIVSLQKRLECTADDQPDDHQPVAEVVEVADEVDTT